MVDEIWREIPEFPRYLVSNFGNIYRERGDFFVSSNFNQYGDLKVTLSDGRISKTLLVRKLVANAFVPNDFDPDIFNTVIHLNGDHGNVAASNLAWRPRWFAWKYSHQFKNFNAFRDYLAYPVLNLREEVAYPSIIEAGIADGVLFEDIWTSMQTGTLVFPAQGPYELV